ncbi:hypothetical protein SVA_3660 [Sulfurifustis variabilis]|uniref:Uncharacterized protein n=1 Tax=Sulfurifustis variabilis TaxID=1675686 RepID=A0A1C7AFP7_9GAMM|nr:hypothetical protein [Sulfurifustis variabilis]BAU50196.1 hypothetical protein SVA_3660 [Sulfurifustis variabilis]
MKRAVASLFALCLLPAVSTALAQGNRAVSETNGEGAFRYTEGGTIDAAANINLPIGDLLGAVLGVSLVEDDDTDGYGYFAGLFARDFQIGHVGVVGSFEELDVDDRDVELTTWEVRGAVYLGNADVFASWAHLDVDPGRLREDSIGSAGAAWYVQPDVRLFGALGFDDANDTYTVGLEVQPDVFDQRASLRFDYTDGDETDGTVSAAFRYFFATPKTLQTRMREDVFF